MAIQKWKLLKKKDISPTPWLPAEERTYELPDGKIVDDFSVTTLPNVAMIVAVTPEEKVVFVKQFKPGFGEVILEFPAGRHEDEHEDLAETALHELEEETGIKADSVEYFATFSGFVTKGTEKVYCYFVENAEFNSEQNLDENEDIEVMTYTYEEVEELLRNNGIPAAITVAAWDQAKRLFGHKFSSWQ